MEYVAITDHYWGEGSALEKGNELNRLKFLENNINKCALGVSAVGGVELI
jgi:hypothetical protein